MEGLYGFEWHDHIATVLQVHLYCWEFVIAVNNNLGILDLCRLGLVRDDLDLIFVDDGSGNRDQFYD